MQIDILTLFPKMFKGPFEESIIKRAIEQKVVQINIHNLRNFTDDPHKTVDDRPYGGGKGMILKIEPIYKAVQQLKKGKKTIPEVILLDPAGEKFNQKLARDLAKKSHIILIAGHYEGVDYRVHQYLADRVISIGDYILTGGEIPAMVLVDAIIRLLPQVLDKETTNTESFLLLDDKKQPLLEFPQYTRPVNFHGWRVPKILLSGNHEEIKKWRLKKARERTKRKRPDLLK